MSITIQQLQAFVTLAETCSFTAAAQKSFMTQPAFSRLIASYEHEMGYQLFNRTTRRVRLTREGEICLQHVHAILAEHDRMLRDLQQLSDTAPALIRVGYNPVSGPPAFFVSALQKLTRVVPSLSVSMTRCYSPDLARMVIEGELDCALVSSAYLPEREDICYRPLQPIYLNALVGVGHPLANKEEILFQDLDNMPIVVMKNTAPRTRNSIMEEFMRRGLQYVENAAINDLEEMIMKVCLNDVVGISSFTDPNHRYPAMRILPLEIYGRPRPNVSRGLAWRKDNENRYISSFCWILDEAAALPASNGMYPFD